MGCGNGGEEEKAGLLSGGVSDHRGGTLRADDAPGAFLLQAATIHSISWKESHRAFCTPDFIETHTPDRQREYLRNKMNNGSKLYMLVEEKPIGVVSVTKGLIEDLYILPDMKNMGYGTKLLLYAVGQCTDTPTLWILENNINAERLYRRIGFKETGRKNAITNRLDEIEFALTQIPV